MSIRNVALFGLLASGCSSSSKPAPPRDMSHSVIDLMVAIADLAAPDLAHCETSRVCPDATPICDFGRCRACTGSNDDVSCGERSSTALHCLASTGMCAACSTPNMQTSDCAATAPICDTTGTCRACASHDECTSRICNLDGTCYGGSVAYADNANGACTGTHAATLADPACEITTALTVQPTVRVFGSTTAYARLTFASGTARVVGPGLPAAGVATAVVSGDTSDPAVSISGATTTITLDGLEITGGGVSQDAVFCGQSSLGPSLTMVRTSIHGVGGAGVDATKCVVTLDRDVIGPSNAGGGIVLNSGTTYSITNTIIGANGASAPGITFSVGTAVITGSAGFMHNTVVKNANGGINCTPATSIVNSIIWGNTGGSDLSANCTPTNSPISPAPDFVNATGPAYDFHLAGRTATNLANYIDQIASSPVDHDVDGRKRPQNVKWDIGAHEVP